VYWEGQHEDGAWAPDPSSEVPTGVLVSAEDIAIRRYAEDGQRIMHWTDLDTGGHCAALEIPDLLIEDIRTFLRRLPGCAVRSLSRTRRAATTEVRLPAARVP